MSQKQKSVTSQLFSPKEMERRARKLEAEGKTPSLADVLAIVQRELSAPELTKSDRNLLRKMRIAR